MSSPSEASEENEYERQRAERIKRNQAMLAQLQVRELAQAVEAVAPVAINAAAEAARRLAVNAKLVTSSGALRRSDRAATAVTTQRLAKAQSSDESASASDTGDSSEQEMSKRKSKGSALEAAVYDPADESSDDSASSSDEDSSDGNEKTAPAKGSKAKGKGSRKSKAKPPAEDEIDDLFQQLQPANGCLTPHGLCGVADQMLTEGTDVGECRALLNFAGRWSGCAPAQLNVEHFAKLISHLYD
ncbi:hypothetical protein WJX73_007305 [Symbiochloris irregularis]|uniref:Uncharacterized protein n=1 Tax=Symbiochloris irregularis TaxID=706552 RepID=A0AAW1P0B1_9CHLO